MTCPRDAALWRYELTGRSALNPWRPVLDVVETEIGEPRGFIAHAAAPSGTVLSIMAYELTPDVSWSAVTPSVLRGLGAIGEAQAARNGGARFERLGFCLGTEHPAFAALRRLEARDEGAYAWYLRVAKLAGFIRHVAPVLERRLAHSDLAAYTGELHLSFFRDGLRLALKRGQLAEVAPWQQPIGLVGIEKGVPTIAPRAAAYFPDLTFLQLLFGYRSLDELQYAFADCVTRTDEARAVLGCLFPKQPSNVWPVL